MHAQTVRRRSTCTAQTLYSCTRTTTLPIVCDGVGGALGAALGRGARARGGKPRARRARVGAGKGGGVIGAEGVARVVSDRLPAMHQPLRAGEPAEPSHGQEKIDKGHTCSAILDTNIVCRYNKIKLYEQSNYMIIRTCKYK